MRIGVCFFGITRSLTWTAPSILSNIIEPAQELGEVRVLGHLYSLAHVANQRSSENGPVLENEQLLLPFDELQQEDQNEVLAQGLLQNLERFGDSWHDGFQSFRNLTLQLHSLSRVTQMALQHDLKCVVFCRPDLVYHDSMGRGLQRMLKRQVAGIALPDWQENGGYNDRFAIALGPDAIAAYGHRIERAQAFCEQEQAPLHSERLLKFALGETPVFNIGVRATRVRVGGVRHKEPNFYPRWAMVALQRIDSLVSGTMLEPPARAVWSGVKRLMRFREFG